MNTNNFTSYVVSLLQGVQEERSTPSRRRMPRRRGGHDTPPPPPVEPTHYTQDSESQDPSEIARSQSDDDLFSDDSIRDFVDSRSTSQLSEHSTASSAADGPLRPDRRNLQIGDVASDDSEEDFDYEPSSPDTGPPSRFSPIASGVSSRESSPHSTSSESTYRSEDAPPEVPLSPIRTRGQIRELERASASRERSSTASPGPGLPGAATWAWSPSRVPGGVRNSDGDGDHSRHSGGGNDTSPDRPVRHRMRAVIAHEADISQLDPHDPQPVNMADQSVMVINSSPENSADEEELLTLSGPRTRKRKADEAGIGGDEAGPSKVAEDVNVKKENLDDSTVDDMCNICFEEYTAAGDHRLVSLKCGHFFGDECIRRWIKTERSGTCPQCKQKAVLRDIRVHFARSVQMTDNTELEKSKRETTVLRSENESLKLDISRLQRRIKDLQKRRSDPQLIVVPQASPGSFRLFPVGFKVICERDGCRSFDYNGEALFLGARIQSGLFAEYCLKRVSTDLRIGTTYPVHSARMRVVAVSPYQATLILTAGEDGTAVVTDIFANSRTHSFKLGSQAWSACWLSESTFVVGQQDGRVMKYDLNEGNLQHPKDLTEGEGRFPIISISHFPDRQAIIISSFKKMYMVRHNHVATLLDSVNTGIHKMNCVACEASTNSIAVTVPAAGAHPTFHVLYRLEECESEVYLKEQARWSSSSVSMTSLFTSHLFIYMDSLCLLTYEEDFQRIVVHDFTEKRKDCFLSIRKAEMPTKVTALRAIKTDSSNDLHLFVLIERGIFSALLRHMP